MWSTSALADFRSWLYWASVLTFEFCLCILIFLRGLNRLVRVLIIHVIGELRSLPFLSIKA